MAFSLSDCTTNLTDLFATAADIVDRDLPDRAAEDSSSLLPVLLGKEERIADRESVFILGNGKDSSVAVCTGKWKLIVRYGDDREPGHELFDLSKDPGELKNVSDEHPEITKRWLQHFSRPMPTGELDARTSPPKGLVTPVSWNCFRVNRAGLRFVGSFPGSNRHLQLSGTSITHALAFFGLIDVAQLITNPNFQRFEWESAA